MTGNIQTETKLSTDDIRITGYLDTLLFITGFYSNSQLAHTYPFAT